jgi:hypothetical protein
LVPDRHRRQSGAQTRRRPERDFTISRAGDFGNPMRVFPSEAHAPCALANNVEGYDDDHFKLLSVGVVLSTAIVTPVFAQQAVSEPGMQAFYRSLGVGSQSSAPSAMASTRSVSYASTPAKHISAKHKM